MELNRHNYESFFLLYIDGELDASAREKVEQFVSEHPDLETELDALRETILRPEEEIVLPSRASLYKNDARLEELMLLQLDEALDAAEAQLLKEIVAKNPAAADAHQWMATARFVPDTSITFPNKHSLYKKEKFRRPVIFNLYRIAAIVLLAFGCWWWMGAIDENYAPLPSSQAFVSKGNTNRVQQEKPLTVSIKRNSSARTSRFIQPAIVKQPVKSPQITQPLQEDEDVTAALTTNLLPALPIQESNNLPTPLVPEQTVITAALSPSSTKVVWKEAALPSSDEPDAVEILNTRFSDRIRLRKIVRAVSRVMEKTTGYHTTGADDPNAIQIANFVVARNN